MKLSMVSLVCVAERSIELTKPKVLSSSPPIMCWSCSSVSLNEKLLVPQKVSPTFSGTEQMVAPPSPFFLFLRSCQYPLRCSWENDLTHRQLLSAAWVILYSRFYWGDLAGPTTSEKKSKKTGVRPPCKGPRVAAKISFGCTGPPVWAKWKWKTPNQGDVRAAALVTFVCTFLCFWQMVWMSTEKEAGKLKREWGFSTVTKGLGGGKWGRPLADKKKELVRGTFSWGVRADEENVRATDLISEAGGQAGGGVNMLRAAQTEDCLSLCSRLGSTSPPTTQEVEKD